MYFSIINLCYSILQMSFFNYQSALFNSTDEFYNYSSYFLKKQVNFPFLKLILVCTLQSNSLLRHSFDGFSQHRQGRIDGLFRLDFDDAFSGGLYRLGGID